MPPTGGKSLRLHEVKAHPEGWVFFLRQREEKFMPPTGGKSLRLYGVMAYPSGWVFPGCVTWKCQVLRLVCFLKYAGVPMKNFSRFAAGFVLLYALSRCGGIGRHASFRY